MSINIHHVTTLRRAPSSCPACGHGLDVRRLACAVCDTSIEGTFSLGPFGRLTKEQLLFVETFMRCRGKIKDVEQELGVSYPTVVARLDDVVAALDPPVMAASGAKPSVSQAARLKILEDISAGVLDAKEGAAKLRALSQTKT